ncbi:MAG: hypothetical protein LUH09_03870 [Clostridiales bacterium]|nr:hypothetical protein [Clostridiales bacterium]
MILPYIWVHSSIGADGTEYITICIQEPEINTRNAYEGGKLVHFDIDNRKQTTDAFTYRFNPMGAPTDWEKIAAWKDEALCEPECLRYCKQWMEEGKL